MSAVCVRLPRSFIGSTQTCTRSSAAFKIACRDPAMTLRTDDAVGVSWRRRRCCPRRARVWSSSAVSALVLSRWVRLVRGYMRIAFKRRLWHHLGIVLGKVRELGADYAAKPRRKKE